MAVAVGTNDRNRNRIRDFVVSRGLGELESRGGKSSVKSVRAQGKFLFTGEEKFCVRGVTYGTVCGTRRWSGIPGARGGGLGL